MGGKESTVSRIGPDMRETVADAAGGDVALDALEAPGRRQGAEEITGGAAVRRIVAVGHGIGSPRQVQRDPKRRGGLGRRLGERLARRGAMPPYFLPYPARAAISSARAEASPMPTPAVSWLGAGVVAVGTAAAEPLGI